MRKITPLPVLSALAVCLCLGQSQAATAQISAACELSPDGVAIAQSMNPECIRWLGRRSLTVIGQGLVTAPADSALLEFRFSSLESSTNADSPGLSLETARQFTETALEPAVNALKTKGVAASNITIQTSSIQNPKLLVKVEKPTQDSLQQLVLAVDQSLKSSQKLFLQSIGAGYFVNACEPLQRSARRIALRDAQSQLTGLAQDVGVELGELLSVTVLPLSGTANSVGCGTKVGVPTTSFSIAPDEANPPYNPSDKPEVQVKSQVSVTHAIKASSIKPK